ncbi:MAG: glucose-6-phosphate dehydrogenase [Proteobacteria bacterium]|nr:glucose-6-phosphate dehydrogenase [Pseudomonadota bacterium]
MGIKEGDTAYLNLDWSVVPIIPKYVDLLIGEMLNEDLKIVGFARQDMSDDQFRRLMGDGVREFADLAVRTDEWDAFAKSLSYVQGDLEQPEDFLRLGRHLAAVEAGGTGANRLYYLSVAPRFFSATVANLQTSGLAETEGGWRRVVIEKPFGRDLKSARSLNSVVHQAFDESQVYRIDHYLGKETVQNLLVLRFGNTIFEPVWNRNYVDNVQITAAEEVTVGDRAGYYDQSGVVRDMVQNHLLQLLTMVAMEPPNAMDADSLRNHKVEVLRAIRRWTPEEATRATVLGQYRGYLEENGVESQSVTPTYAALRLYVDNWRWQGVPFYLRTGKSMADKVTEIVIQFRCPPHMMFASGGGGALDPNLLSLCLQPDEGLHLRFGVKVPGEGMVMGTKDLEFHYASAFKEQAIPEAYERLLQDALEGDASLFIRSDHIEEAWRIVEPIIDSKENSINQPQRYEPGSWGPPAADALLAETANSWWQVCGEHGSAHA